MKEIKNNLSPLVLNLNTYSHYSLLSSSLSIDQIIEFAINENKQFVCLTDTNLYGAMEFYLKCKKNNLIPVIGLSIINNGGEFILFAKNKKGYCNLVKISSFLLNEIEFQFENYLDDLFIVVKQGTFPYKTKSNVYYTDSSKGKTIAFNESRYLTRKEKKIYNALLAIRDNIVTTVSALEEGDDFHLLTNEDFCNSFTQQEIETLNDEIKDANLEIDFEKNNIIEYQKNSKQPSKKTLHDFCINSLNQKILDKQINEDEKEKYIQRLEHELEIINSMGFNDYFLVVQDFINETKNKNILIGPGRGSAAGSLVAFLLGITEIDSIKYNLLFERFLNPGRVTMPDIDIDIMDVRRDEVVDYIFDRYGNDHVAHIITFQRIKAKMALRDVGRILGIDLKEINSICKNIGNDVDVNLKEATNKKELKASYNSHKDLFDIAIGIIGCPRQTGIHAAGVVLSKKPLIDIVPTQRSVNGEITTQYSMEYLEDLGLIKMDLLGLTNLSTINYVCTLIKKNYNIDVDLKNINLNDNEVFKDAQNGYTLGIFQLESPGMTSVVKKVKPASIEDISICSALYRPGPMQNIKSLVARRNGQETIEYIDPKNKDILEPTYGIIVYQEQVINLVRKIANFSLGEADIFRRIISKKKEKDLVEFKKTFFDNAKKNGYTEDELNNIYNFIYTFADYGFNHSHSVAYSLISYWLLYLKHYYPIEFMLILMTFSENDKTKINLYINECKRLKINIKKPDINLSNKSFALHRKGGKNTILFGLSSIKGIGSETSKKIIDIRNSLKDKKFADFNNAVKQLSANKIGQSIIETLILGGAFDSFNLSKKFMLVNLVEIVSLINNSNGYISQEGSKFFDEINNEVEETELEKQEFIKKEFDLLGVDFNNLDDNSINQQDIEKYSKYNHKAINDPTNDGLFESIVSIKSVKVTKSKKGTDMIIVNLTDIYNNKGSLMGFGQNLINSVENLDLSKKYLMLLKISNYGVNIVKIKEQLE